MKKTILLMIVTLACVTIGFAACESSKELTRAAARRQIEAGKDFKQPLVLPLTQNKGVNSYGVTLKVDESREETPAQAAARRAAEYYEEYPQAAVANYLGLVEAVVKARNPVQPKRESSWNYPVWTLDEKYLASDKGKALWQQYGLPASEDTVPLAGREIVEITGITKQGENWAAVQLTYRYVPNAAGKAFDRSTAEFKAMPLELQQLLDGTTDEQKGYVKKNLMHDFSAVRQAEAGFQKYDDGWRLQGVRFY